MSSLSESAQDTPAVEGLTVLELGPAWQPQMKELAAGKAAYRSNHRLATYLDVLSNLNGIAVLRISLEYPLEPISSLHNFGADN